MQNNAQSFHMKITAIVMKITAWCYLHLPVFSFTYTLLVCGKINSCCDLCFPQQIRPLNTVQLFILQDYSSVRIGFSMNNKRLSFSVVYTMLV